jgi:tetratricopeptide (TPR) repeat protein
MLNPINIDSKTVEALQKIITGDPVSDEGTLAPYRSGPELVNFFNQFGKNDEYGEGFPSRWMYAEASISELNGTPALIKVIEGAIDPRAYLGSNQSIDDAVDYLNQFLEFDGYKLMKNGNRYKLSSIDKEIVTFEHAILDNNAPNMDFIREQNFKCRSKLNSGDYDGAITNARSLLEAVLLEMEFKITCTAGKYDGDLNKLYKRVQKLLNLDPSREDISNSLKQLLTGIVSIIGGIAAVRNKMSDAHARSYKPAEHHAKLAVNSVHTLCMFLLESFEHQVKAGHLQLMHKKTVK